MPTKQQKPPRRRSAVSRSWAQALAAAAVSATCVATALTTGAAVTVSAPAVDLTALVTPANSTAQIFASSEFYGVPWVQTYGQPQVVPFFLGPQGIVNAIDNNTGDPKGIAVLASGWGAGQTGSALRIMQANNDPAMSQIKIMVLDNNTNRAGGGFWTTYWPFAPLLLTTAAPTPSDTTVPVLDVAYEYNINSDAPTNPLNVIADVNSLAAYIFNYGGQATAQLPPEALNPSPADAQHYHYVVDAHGNIINQYEVSGNITYVTVKADRLPLVRPLLLIPGGGVLADAVEPALTKLVNAGYKDNRPIPQDPGVPRPMSLFPSSSGSASTVSDVQKSAPGGKPSEIGGTTPSLAGSSTASTKPSALVVDMASGAKFSPSKSNPVRQVVGGFAPAPGDLPSPASTSVKNKKNESPAPSPATGSGGPPGNSAN
jgi:PE-PPE domain